MSGWPHFVLAALLAAGGTSGCGMPATSMVARGDLAAGVPRVRLQVAFRPPGRRLTQYTQASVAYVALTLHEVVGATVRPVLREGFPLLVTVQVADLGEPIAFTGLKRDTWYQVQAWAFDGADGLISDPTTSIVEVVVGQDDALAIPLLQVQLVDAITP